MIKFCFFIDLCIFNTVIFFSRQRKVIFAAFNPTLSIVETYVVKIDFGFIVSTAQV